mgnify:FL=1
MFNGLFGGGCPNEDAGVNGCGGDCTWIILIVLFLCCCCGKNKSFSLCVNPCCLILMLALLYCCGGIRFGKGCM